MSEAHNLLEAQDLLEGEDMLEGELPHTLVVDVPEIGAQMIPVPAHMPDPLPGPGTQTQIRLVHRHFEDISVVIR